MKSTILKLVSVSLIVMLGVGAAKNDKVVQEFKKYAGVCKSPESPLDFGYSDVLLQTERAALLEKCVEDSKKTETQKLQSVRWSVSKDFVAADFLAEPPSLQDKKIYGKPMFFYYQTGPSNFHLAAINVSFSGYHFQEVRDGLISKYGKPNNESGLRLGGEGVRGGKIYLWKQSGGTIMLTPGEPSTQPAVFYNSDWGQAEMDRRKAIRDKETGTKF